jgi:predicted dehydrogenase
MPPPLRIALIGHKFMGNAHQHALQDVDLFFDSGLRPIRRTLCGIEDDVAGTAERWGWERWTHDWREAVADPNVDAVDIATPGNTHAGIAIATAKAGKHVLCEKPLALTSAEARAMLDAATAAGVTHGVNCNYRRLPAVALAQKLIAAGELGEIYYFRATYWQDWPLAADFPWVWRFDRATAGAGSMADKGSHLVDLARYLVGEFAEVAATSEIFVRERPASGGTKPVTTDDAAAFLARFSSGFEVNGSKGSVIFDLERLNELRLYSTSDRADAQGFRTVLVTQPEHPYIKSWWPPEHSPSFADGLRAQEVLDAVEQAAREKRWVEIPQ